MKLWRNVVRTLIAALFTALVALPSTTAFAQHAPKGPAPINALMSAADRQATGIDTLTPAQVAALSAWLDNYRVAAEWLAVTQAQGEDMVEPAEELIKTEIDGDFDGWVGDTVFRLQNGQVWQQIGPSAKYLFARSPRVTIARTYQMQVDGVTVELPVRRVR